MSEPASEPQAGRLHLTPAIGYVDLRAAKTSGELWEMLETALDCAKSSLEIEPFQYDPKSNPAHRRNFLVGLLELWAKAPSPVALTVQFVLSLLIGWGAPFLLYAICDALGVDISGPVYIGVVVVLVITATTIWIEGFLALKPTAPPQTPGSPYPLATVIIPAYLPNEAATIVETLNAFLRLDYPNTIQVILAYNYPGTRMPVEDELDAIAARENGSGRFIIEPIRVLGSTSKAQNVNAVIGRVRGRFVGIFDADHHPLPDSLLRAWRWLSNGWDIVQGRCSIRNGSDSWVARMVAIEFEQIYAVSHPGRARFHGFGIFGGSNGFWRTAVLHETRMRHAMLTEDIDSSIRAVEGGYRIAGDRDLISEELAPTSWSQLLNQRLRWAQGWFQVSLQRITPALLSRRVTVRQKLGLLHLLIWREFFPWYSIQVVPIVAYWVWVYGWRYIQWAIPIFVITTIYTFSTGPSQVLFAYLLARKSMRRRPGWFVEYLIVSTIFYAPFKDTLSRIAHLKEAMRERAWRVTPRIASAKAQPQFASAALVAALVVLFSAGGGMAQTREGAKKSVISRAQIAALIGGEVSTINAARQAASKGRNAEAARLFEQAIAAVPRRRPELLREYADALIWSGRSAEAAPLYRELLASPTPDAAERLDLLKQRALALTWSRQHQAALAAYEDLMARTPGDPAPAVNRARVLAWLGRENEALAALDKVPAQQWATGPLSSLGEEVVVEAARAAARANRNAAAAGLFDRAIRHNALLRPRLLKEYADQVLFSRRAADSVPLYREVLESRLATGAARTEALSNMAEALMQGGRPRDAIPLYREALSQTSPGDKAYLKAQRAICVALTWANAPAEALAAWTAYLRSAPSDIDALVNRARLLSAAHRNKEALQVYRTAQAMDRGNEAARRGVVDETITLARIAARSDENATAAALFDAAISLDSRKRQDLRREYADQLTFSDRPAKAIPLYRQALNSGALSKLDRRRALTGLADAYIGAARPAEALATYDQLVAAFPGDTDLRWVRLVFSARQAAQADKNTESAELFAQAIKVNATRSASILREYADQLNFSSRSAEAVPVYRLVLADAALTDLDRRRAMSGLADALAWSGRQGEAMEAYTALADAHPEEASLQRTRLVYAARQAARNDKNAESAELFALAIKLDPAHRNGLLREYADQLSFSGRAPAAIGVYREVLGQPALDPAELLAGKKGLAQAYEWADRPGEAKLVLIELLGKYPDDLSLQWERLVATAREAAKADRNQEAADLFAEAIRIVPSKASTILKEYADKLTFAKNPKAAIPLYRKVIAQNAKPAEWRSNQFALALALVWNNQPKEALREYQRVIAANPSDFEARSGAARILAWIGRQGEAKAAYQQILSDAPGNAEALRGLALVEDRQGHHRAAQTLLRQRLDDDRNDLEAYRMLAQSQVWMGRPDKAMNEVDHALTQEQMARRMPSRKVGPSDTLQLAEGSEFQQAAGTADAAASPPERNFLKAILDAGDRSKIGLQTTKVSTEIRQ